MASEPAMCLVGRGHTKVTAYRKNISILLHSQSGCGLTHEATETGEDGVWKTLVLSEGPVDSPSQEPAPCYRVMGGEPELTSLEGPEAENLTVLLSELACKL